MVHYLKKLNKKKLAVDSFGRPPQRHDFAQITKAMFQRPWEGTHVANPWCDSPKFGGCFLAGTFPLIGSMYAICGNIYHQYTPNVSIYTIHGSKNRQILLRLFPQRLWRSFCQIVQGIIDRRCDLIIFWPTSPWVKRYAPLVIEAMENDP